MSTQPGTLVTVTQSVESMEGGQATGVSVGRITGDVTVTSNTYLYNRPSLPPKPPPLAVVRAYLEAASRPDKPGADKSSEEASLWKIPFRAHRADEGQEQDLYQAIQEAFALHLQQGGFNRLMLLGDNGMGKTPALHYLRRKRSEASLHSLDELAISGKTPTNKKQFVIPIFIRLANLTPDQTLVSLLRDSFNTYINTNKEVDNITTDQSNGLLEKYTCLFLFDGLSELLARGRLGGFQNLSHFIETYREHQYVITTRTSMYRQQLGPLDTLYLDPLTEEEAVSIVGEVQYNRLSPSSKQLARNRKVLSLYIGLGKSSELLQTTGRLIQSLTRHQLEIYKKSLEEQVFSFEILEELLEQLAIKMRFEHVHCYSNQDLMEFVTGYLQAWKEPTHWRKVAQELVKADLLFYDNEKRQWRFRHRTVESYFAAAAVLNDRSKLQLLLKEVSDYWWRDVFEMLVGLYPEPSELLLELIDRDALVAANSIRFVGETVGAAVENALIDALDERMRLENSLRRKYIVERIGVSNHPRAAESLMRAIHRDWSSIVVLSAVKSLTAWHDRTHISIREAEQKLLDTYFGPVEPISELIYLCGNQQQQEECDIQALLNILKRRANSSKRRGLAAIGLGFSGTPEAMDALFDIMIHEKTDDFVAWCAVEALTQIKHPKVHECAARLFRTKENGKKQVSHLRVRAVYLLGWTGTNAEAEILLREALNDPNWFVRGYAIEAIARLDLVGARQQIEQKLVDEEEPFVLRKVVEALGKIGTLESIPILERHLFNELAGNRWSLRQAIAEIQVRNGI